MSEIPSENPEAQKDQINISEVKIPEAVLNNPGLGSVAMGLCLVQMQSFIFEPARPIAEKVYSDLYRTQDQEPSTQSTTAEQLLWAAVNFYTAGQRARYDIHRTKSTPQQGDIITLPEDLYVQVLRDYPDDKFIVTPDITPAKPSALARANKDPHTALTHFVGFHYAIDEFLWEQMRIQYQAAFDLLEGLEPNRREFFMEPVRTQLEMGSIVASVGLPHPAWQEARTAAYDNLLFRQFVDKEGNISRNIITRWFNTPQEQELALAAIKLVHPLNTERPAQFTQAAKEHLLEYTPQIRSIKGNIAQISPFEKFLLPYDKRDQLLAQIKPDELITDPSAEWPTSIKDFVKTLKLDDPQK